MKYTNTLAELVNATGIGRWEEVDENTVGFLHNSTTVCIQRNPDWGEEYLLTVSDIDQHEGDSGWFSSLENACKQAVAFSQGDVAWITAEPRSLGWYSLDDASFEIAADGHHVTLVSEAWMILKPLKRVRLHSLGHNSFELVNLVSGKSYMLKPGYGGDYWDIA